MIEGGFYEHPFGVCCFAVTLLARLHVERSEVDDGRLLGNVKGVIVIVNDGWMVG